MNLTKVGFTGSRNEPTPKQVSRFVLLMRALQPVEFHHGDCVGCDAKAHELVQKFNNPIVIHPPVDGKLRAYCKLSAEIMPQYDYLTRNRHIVNACDILIAMPYSDDEVLRSGTWSTIRYAHKLKKPTIIIYPKGNLWIPGKDIEWPAK